MMNTLKNYINGRSCELLGLGVSNLPLAMEIAEMGVGLTVRDKKSIEELGEGAKTLASRGVRFVTGERAFDELSGDVIFRSPGIRPDRACLVGAKARGGEITSEMELFLALTQARTFGVTGSDGKTTTTTLTGEFLSAQAQRRGNRCFVGGNIGEPLLHKLDLMTPHDYAVTELSSFQLMTVRKAPRFAAITNISPNHLDWHTGMEEYQRAKLNIVGEGTERLVTNADNERTAAIAAELLRSENRPALYLFSSTKGSFEEIYPMGHRVGDCGVYEKDGFIVLSDGKREKRLLSTDRIHVPGRHNLENFMTAVALTYGQVDEDVYGEVADRFFGVAHRLELIRTLDGVDYFNSSIDSSPTRTLAALSALDGRDIVIICGGYDKKIPYEPLAEGLTKQVRAAVFTGATGGKIERALLECDGYREGCPEYVYEPDFERAVRRARKMARAGGCVLLSPASASFDAFPNFAVRGDTFRRIVNGFEAAEGDKN